MRLITLICFPVSQFPSSTSLTHVLDPALRANRTLDPLLLKSLMASTVWECAADYYVTFSEVGLHYCARESSYRERHSLNGLADCISEEEFMKNVSMIQLPPANDGRCFLNSSLKGVAILAHCEIPPPASTLSSNFKVIPISDSWSHYLWMYTSLFSSLFSMFCFFDALLIEEVAAVDTLQRYGFHFLSSRVTLCVSSLKLSNASSHYGFIRRHLEE